MKLKQLEEKIEAEFQKLETKLHGLFHLEGAKADISAAIANAKTATQQVAVDHVQNVVADGVPKAVADAKAAGTPASATDTTKG